MDNFESNPNKPFKLLSNDKINKISNVFFKIKANNLATTYMNLSLIDDKSFKFQDKANHGSSKAFTIKDIAYTGLANSIKLLDLSTNIHHIPVTIPGLNLFSKQATKDLIKADKGNYNRLYFDALDYTTTEAKINAANNLLFGGSTGVDQGKASDCWFEASVASLALSLRGQKLITQLITQNPNGSYTVTFPGKPQSPINVSLSEINNPNEVNTTKWANILEVALKKIEPNRYNHGAIPEDGLRLLTGDASDLILTANVITPSDYAAFRQDLERSLRNGDPIVASINLNIQSDLGHLFSVIGYNANTDKITVRNPWGFNVIGGLNKLGSYRIPHAGYSQNGIENLGGGIIAMPLTDFINCFYALTYVPKHLTTFQIVNNSQKTINDDLIKKLFA